MNLLLRFRKAPWVLGALIGAFGYLVIWAVPDFLGGWENAPWRVIDRAVSDFTVRNRVNSKPPSEVALVLIDDDSVEKLGWPFKRGIYADLLDRLFEAGASHVIFDVVFSTPSGHGEEEDRKFADAIRRHGHVTLAGFLPDGPDGERDLLLPIPTLAEVASFGVALNPRDADQVLRQARFAVTHRGKTYDTLDSRLVEALLSVHGQSGNIRRMENRWEINSDLGFTRTVEDPDIPRIILFSGPPRWFPSQSISRVLSATAPSQLSEFAGKVVLVGASANILQDNHSVPFWSGGIRDLMPGVEIHANAGIAFINGRCLKQLPGWFFPFFFLVSMVVGIVALWIRPTQSVVFCFSFAASFFLWAMGLVVLERNTFIPAGSLAATSLVILFVAILIRRSLLEKMFKYYVPAHVVERLETDTSFFGAKVANRHCTVLFLDIRGFTPLTGSLPLERLVEVLNTFLGACGRVIQEHQGYVDKYIGDAVMAVFGDPERGANHASQAVKCAIDIQNVVSKLNQGWASEGISLRIGIGINSGPLMIGNFGGEARYEYTVIGEAVNIASRLQDATKDHGTTGILLSAASHSLATNDPALPGCRPVGNLSLKGIRQEVETFEPVL